MTMTLVASPCGRGKDAVGLVLGIRAADAREPLDDGVNFLFVGGIGAGVAAGTFGRGA